jgi:hypothetical protein
MSILVKFQSNWSRDGLCTACTNVQVSKGQFMRNDLGTSKSWKCDQGLQAPHESIQNSVLTCEIMYAMFKES